MLDAGGGGDKEGAEDMALSNSGGSLLELMVLPGLAWPLLVLGDT